jgi:nitrite reductase/ring-hydroxylating ferredoxin subunit
VSWLTDRLTTLMQERAQSVPTLARELGIERSRLAHIVAGSAIPNENLLQRLARHFGEQPEEWTRHARQPEPAAPTPLVPTDFVRLATVAEVPDGAMKVVFNGLVVLANAEGRFHAFGNICPHAAGPIGEGWLEGRVVECPWHNGQWDITTGEALTELATADIPVFEVRVAGDDIEVKLTPAVHQRVPSGHEPGASS